MSPPGKSAVEVNVKVRYYLYVCIERPYLEGCQLFVEIPVLILTEKWQFVICEEDLGARPCRTPSLCREILQYRT